MPTFHGINVVSIAVPDLARAKDFYGRVLELGEPVFDIPEAGWVEFSTGPSSGNLSITTEGWGSPVNGNTTLVLNTQDCRAACERLRAKDVRCDDPVEFSGFVVFCTFYDPFGNRLQMCSPADAQLSATDVIG
jgi:predicted enzyme related to lactoylglutathione lyase